MTCSGPFRAMIRSVAGIQNCIHSLRALSWFAGVLLVLFVSPLSTSGQATQFTRTIWRSRDGLPENAFRPLPRIVMVICG